MEAGSLTRCEALFTRVAEGAGVCGSNISNTKSGEYLEYDGRLSASIEAEISEEEGLLVSIRARFEDFKGF